MYMYIYYIKIVLKNEESQTEKKYLQNISDKRLVHKEFLKLNKKQTTQLKK